MKTLSLFAVALIASAALISSGCSEPGTAPASDPAPPAAGSGGDTGAGGSSTSSTTDGAGGAELTSVSFNVEGMT